VNTISSQSHTGGRGRLQSHTIAKRNLKAVFAPRCCSVSRIETWPSGNGIARI